MPMSLAAFHRASVSHPAFRATCRALAVLALCLPAVTTHAADPVPGPPLSIQRAAGPITIDGVLDDAGWQNVTGVTQWFETRVGDNVEPHVRNVGYLTYDDKYLYAAFRFDDPQPRLVRAPLGDHDQLSGTTDYGGIIVDSRNDGKTAQMFLANPSGLQYDALSSDVTGEDSAPDWFWDTAGKITEQGWTMEIRVPFSTLRYSNMPTPTWGILLYRNYPRERRFQFFSAKLPRDVNCFICNSSKLTGLDQLPHGSHLVVAPFAASQRTAEPSAGLGSPMAAAEVDSRVGMDIKWNPLTGLAVDATVKPDFSQIEADVAQISANERFALFYPEKRPFFLEGVDLLATPFQAVYTRTVTDPLAGVRATGRAGSTAFTGLVVRDAGQGTVIIPGPQGSLPVDQDFRSDVGTVRARRDMGQSFVSALGTFREHEEGGAYNRVFGPDLQWRPRTTDTFTGQALWSATQTPVRTDLADEWDGRYLADHAFTANWNHSTPTVDWYIQAQELGEDFRADNGFIPQVGYRELYAQAGYTWRPESTFYNRIRVFVEAYEDQLLDGAPLTRHALVGVGADGRLASFLQLLLAANEFLVGTETLQRVRPRLILEASPSRTIGNLSLTVLTGQEIDFDNAREGTGTSVTFTGTWRPEIHTTLTGNASVRWLDVDAGTAGKGRLFTAHVERLRGTYMFNSRMFVRLIGQYVETSRDPALYTFAVNAKDANLSLSGLFAYKLNWQTVFYLGYGDQNDWHEPSAKLEKRGQQAFLKLSYALQM
jgi:hypothetical protein